MLRILSCDCASAAQGHSRADTERRFVRSLQFALRVAFVAGATLLPVISAEAQVLRQPGVQVALGERIVPGEIVVRFEPGTSDETRDQVLSEVNGSFAGAPLVQKDVVVAKVPVGTEIASAASLKVDTNVLDAEPNVVGQSTPLESALR